MTKPEDIEFEEAWPTLSKILPWTLTIGVIWLFYQGLALTTGNYGWPLTIPLWQPTPETYQQYIANYKQSQGVFQWVLGPMFILLPIWVLRRPIFRFVRRMLNRRTEEAKTE